MKVKTRYNIAQKVSRQKDLTSKQTENKEVKLATKLQKKIRKFF